MYELKGVGKLQIKWPCFEDVYVISVMALSQGESKKVKVKTCGKKRMKGILIHVCPG